MKMPPKKPTPYTKKQLEELERMKIEMFQARNEANRLYNLYQMLKRKSQSYIQQAASLQKQIHEAESERLGMDLIDQIDEKDLDKNYERWLHEKRVLEKLR